jgi:hypothetical protein
MAAVSFCLFRYTLNGVTHQCVLLRHSANHSHVTEIVASTETNESTKS